MEFCYKKGATLSLERAMSLEWLETNGLGGYASSTATNCNTRKYHGLLVSKINALPDKYVLLSKLDDLFVCDGIEYPLSAHSFPNSFQNGSFDYYQHFLLNTHPEFSYEFNGITLTKEILMPYEEDTVFIKYKVVGNVATSIKIRPLVACRNFHNLSKENHYLKSDVTNCLHGVSLSPYGGMPTLFFQVNGDINFNYEPVWYRNFIYDLDRKRGYDFYEDLFSPGIITLNFDKTNEVIFSCSTKELRASLEEKWRSEIERRAKFDARIQGTSLQKQLKKVGTSFLQKSSELKSQGVVAGYHWFLEWGRDAMISLPGLTLYSGLENECLEILKAFSKHEYRGLLPNFIGETRDKNAYNSIDASLWFGWAVQQYFNKTQDIKFIIQDLWPTLINIFDYYKNGTLHGIKMQKNGLLYAEDKANLTWMDVLVDGVPLTPRNGFQVEINALWFNYLCFLQYLAKLSLHALQFELKPLIKLVEKSFCEMFWNPELGYLYDFVNDEHKDSSIRPNQIFAVSLPYSPLPRNMAVKVVNVVKEHLLTPYGLRTLSPQDEKYIGSNGDNVKDLDRAYHNGSIWPWLLGHFGEALLKTTNNKKNTIQIIRPSLEALSAHLSDVGVGTISELFSGEGPYVPEGCISQAWSVAEILRLTYLLNSGI